MHTGATEILWRVGSIGKVPSIWVERALDRRGDPGEVRPSGSWWECREAVASCGGKPTFLIASGNLA